MSAGAAGFIRHLLEGVLAIIKRLFTLGEGFFIPGLTFVPRELALSLFIKLKRVSHDEVPISSHVRSLAALN